MIGKHSYPLTQLQRFFEHQLLRAYQVIWAISDTIDVALEIAGIADAVCGVVHMVELASRCHLTAHNRLRLRHVVAGLWNGWQRERYELMWLYIIIDME